MQKSRRFGQTHEAVKVKLASLSSYREKIQLLTLTPESWTLRYSASFFGVSEYVIKRAREARAKGGSLTLPAEKKGNELTNVQLR